MRVQTVLLAAILVVVLLVGIFLMAGIASLRSNIDAVEQNIGEAVSALTEAADGLSGMDVDAMNETISSLKGATDNLSQVDMNALNDLVNSLRTVAEQLEGAVGVISGIFGR